MKLIAYRLPSAAPDSPALMGVLTGESVTPLTSLEAFYRTPPSGATRRPRPPARRWR
jgi:hypothetical protein